MGLRLRLRDPYLYDLERWRMYDSLHEAESVPETSHVLCRSRCQCHGQYWNHDPATRGTVLFLINAPET